MYIYGYLVDCQERLLSLPIVTISFNFALFPTYMAILDLAV